MTGIFRTTAFVGAVALLAATPTLADNTVSSPEQAKVRTYEAKFFSKMSYVKIVNALETFSFDELDVDRCDISGLLGGDCLELITMRSTIPPAAAGEAAQAESALRERCHAAWSQARKYDACVEKVKRSRYHPRPEDLSEDVSRTCGKEHLVPVECPYDSGQN